MAKERKIPDVNERRPPHHIHFRIFGTIMNLTDKTNNVKKTNESEVLPHPEDAIHFLTTCRMLYKERNTLIIINTWTTLSYRNLQNKLTGILKKTKAITNLLQYIRKIYTIRNTLLNKKTISERHE